MKDNEIEEKMFEIMHTVIQNQGDIPGIKKYRTERKQFIYWLKENKIVPDAIKDEWLREKVERLIKKAKEEI